VTPGGLAAGPYFFQLLFPAMLLVLVIFRIGIRVSPSHISRPIGFLLLGVYLLTIGIAYLGGIRFH